MTNFSLTKRAAKVLAGHPLARARDFAAAGITGTELHRLVEQGHVEKVVRGRYRDPRVESSGKADVALAASQVPQGVVCLLTALRFHGLTVQNPFEVWMAVPSKAWRPRIEHPPLRLVFLSPSAFAQGVETHNVDGVPVRIFSAAKTVADCFRFRNRVGVDVAVEALRDYLRVRPKELDALVREARANKVAKVMQPYLEALA
jgi:predicted transcriptional regulator of viral defense system